jgi:hypothetical protein
MTENWLENMKNGSTGDVFLDLSAAFDLADHDTLCKNGCRL